MQAAADGRQGLVVAVVEVEVVVVVDVGFAMEVVVVPIRSVNLVVVVGRLVVVVAGTGVVVPVAQPFALQASQQLENAPTQALPLRGALQRRPLRLMLQWLLPPALVRQQVTKPGCPHVERAAHAITSSLHCLRSVPAVTAFFATVFTQDMYARRLGPPQSHCDAAAARVAATASISPATAPHFGFAAAGVLASAKSVRTTAPATTDRHELRMRRMAWAGYHRRPRRCQRESRPLETPRPAAITSTEFPLPRPVGGEFQGRGGGS